MARMYPQEMDRKPDSEAEATLFKLFRDQLGADYTVFYSVAWQALDSSGRPREGEVDFVIAHPQRGVLLLEVKGGEIKVDPRVGWVSIDRLGRQHTIKDPFEQSMRSKHVLQDYLRAVMHLPQEHRVNIGHAAAFPESIIARALPGLDKPREIIGDRQDMENVTSWVGTVMDYWRPMQGNITPGAGAVNALVQLLGRSYEIHPVLWGQILDERQQLIRLTEEQYRYLDLLSRQNRAAICGCAGSGKTMLASEKAVRLARQGFHVLLTCFNKALASHLRERLRPADNLEIVHFHELCAQLAGEAGVLPQNQEINENYFNTVLPNALLDAVDKVAVRYDAIVVDEGQDFRDEWWIPLQALLKDPEHGIFYIFYDDNQRLYVTAGAYPIHPPYALTVNCRNTQSIHAQVTRFYRNTDAQPVALGPAGRPTEVIFFRENDSLSKPLNNLLQRLVHDQHVPTDEIVILTPLSQSKTALANLSTTIALTIQWPPPPNQVCYSSIHSFKGLESAIVVLVEAERWPAYWNDLEPLLYVACSRPHHQLIVLLPESVTPELRSLFAQPA